jgi:hypothetical protein
MNDNLIDLENKPKFGKSEILLICCIVFQLTICLMPFHYGDGYFRDELYFIAMSNHLSWGNVDVPPLAPFMLYIVRSLFGTSLFTIRLLPAIIGSIIILLNYKIVKIFNGGFFALLLALIPITYFSISVGATYTYDRFDFLFWDLMIFSIIKLLTTEKKKYWIYFGIFAGLGLLSKITIVFLGSGIVFGMIFTKERKYFKNIHFWIAGLIALLIFTPYIIWNFQNGFPTVEFFSNYASGKVRPLSTFFYISEQFGIPIFIPLWLGGIYYLIFNKKGKMFRVLGIAYIIVLIECILMNQKPYIIFPFRPLIFVGGAVFLEAVLKKPKLLFLKVIYVGLILIYRIQTFPTIMPVLPLQTYLKYYGDTGVEVERIKKGLLNSYYANRFGWKELAEKVAKVYNSLPPEQRAKTAILTGNYGQAGAIALFGKKYGLPEPISGHNQYYLWGPKNFTGESLIHIGGTKEGLQYSFNEVKLMDRTTNKYGVVFEQNLPIFLCEEPKFKSLKEVWSTVKHYD